MRRSPGQSVETGIVNQDVMCQAGERATGGGWEWSGYAQDRYPVKSHPINALGQAASPGATPVGWTAAGYKGDAGTTRTFYAWVLCAAP
jgi:hypothetical protein